jgi:hypothetical protein
MLKMIKTAVLSALIGLGGIAAIPAAAQADGLYLNFGGGSGMGFHVDDRYGRHDWRHDRRDWRRGCSPERALNKAERMGLRRARIIGAGPRTVKVAGRRFHDRQIVVFANERGCPVIYR